MAELCPIPIRLDLSRCSPAPDRRRRFWATQPDCASEEDACGPCGVPGLRPVDVIDDCRTCMLGCHDSCSHPPPLGVSLDTSEWVRGLALNILMTDARRDDTACGHRPGMRGGHWSESFVRSSIGSRWREIPATCAIAELVKLIETYVESDLSKLVAYGVATSVEVAVAYAGNNTMKIEATINGQAFGSARVGASLARLPNGWAWGEAA